MCTFRLIVVWFTSVELQNELTTDLFTPQFHFTNYLQTHTHTTSLID